MGVTDLVELMQCRTCLNFDSNNNICKLENKKVKLDNTCSLWEELILPKDSLLKVYNLIKEVFSNYIDTKSDNYEIVSLWLIGTWLHKNFNTFPYLFVNAMKGSGKTRFLKLVKELAKDGDLLASLSEAVMFRTTGTLCIDEFESIKNKEKQALRELLNTAYKKGGKVKRMRKVKNIEGEQQVVDEFNTFRPLCMANINGMEEVLADRCINIILEKSDNDIITRMIENFDDNPKIIEIKSILKILAIQRSWRSVYRGENSIYTQWNDYIKQYTLLYINTLPNANIHNYVIEPELEKLFKKIYETNINGRNLELTLPLILIAYEIGIEDSFIKIIESIVSEKKDEDTIESRDIMIYEFISKQDSEDWYKIKELTNIFRQEIDFDEAEEHWLTYNWFGRALKRLNLRKEHRRMHEGIEVKLDVSKAINKMRIFKPIVIKGKEVQQVNQPVMSDKGIISKTETLPSLTPAEIPQAHSPLPEDNNQQNKQVNTSNVNSNFVDNPEEKVSNSHLDSVSPYPQGSNNYEEYLKLGKEINPTLMKEKEDEDKFCCKCGVFVPNPLKLNFKSYCGGCYNVEAKRRSPE